jgi:hypothetical protein
MARACVGAAAAEEELTDHQRRIFTAIVLDAVPLDALAVELGSSRNAICKTMFDGKTPPAADANRTDGSRGEPSPADTDEEPAHAFAASR